MRELTRYARPERPTTTSDPITPNTAIETDKPAGSQSRCCVSGYSCMQPIWSGRTFANGEEAEPRRALKNPERSMDKPHLLGLPKPSEAPI